MVCTAVFVIFVAAVFHIEAGPLGKATHGDVDTKCPLMVKVLDAVRGMPAVAVKVTVSRRATDNSWTEVTSGVTNAAGEAHSLIKEEDFLTGTYKVGFNTKAYWKTEGIIAFHEVADVVFGAHTDGHRHYTLALLLSPFSYTATTVLTDVHE